MISYHQNNHFNSVVAIDGPEDRNLVGGNNVGIVESVAFTGLAMSKND